ncbi:MAG: YhdP family protein [Methylococcales bacterium]|nr:YhdP family protein [Methylococcales bacterium]
MRRFLFWSLIAAALALTAMRLFLADVAGHKTQLEEKIRQTAHIPIQIGKLSGHMHFFSPGIILQDVVVEATDSGAEPAITLKEARIRVDLLHLLMTGNPMQAITVTLLGAKAEVIRNSDGKVFIKGLPTNGEQPLWLLQGRQYAILESKIDWQDLKHDRNRAALRNFNLLLKNRSASHEIHVLTTLNKLYGDSLRISALIDGDIFKADDLAGQIYVEGVNLQAAALTVCGLPFNYQILSGSGNVEIWSQWRHSRPYRIAGHIQARQIGIANPLGKSLQLDTIEANASWLAKQDGWRLGVHDLDAAAGGRLWNDAEFYLQNGGQNIWFGLIKRLDLGAVAYIAPLFLPAENQYQPWLQLNPGGLLSNLSFYTQPGSEHYALRGDFSGLSIATIHSIPGLQGLSGRINGSDDHGRIEFASEDAQLDAPMLFRNNLHIKALNGGIDWRQQDGDWRFGGKGFVIDSPDFRTRTNFEIVLPKNRASPYVDVRLQFGDIADISKLPLYYPARVMDRDALKWMDQAFIAGRIAHGEITMRGHLDQFPFDNGQGLFETLFSVENGELQFNPDWPHAKDINADIHYLGKDLRVAINSGHGENVEIKQLLVSIHSLPVSEHAEITGQLQSPLQNALLFLQKTPLHAQVTPLLNLVELEGSTQVDLDLSIPYHANMPFGVNVDAHFNNANLTFKPINLLFSQIGGVLHFTENRISSQQLTAQLLGYPVHGTVASDSSAIRLQAKGASSAEALQKQFSFLQNKIASGGFNFQTELTVPQQVNQPQTLSISSNLQGLTVDSHDFLGKTAKELRPFRLDFQFNNKPLLPLRVHYGNELNAALLVDLVGNRLYSGDVVVGRHEADTEQQPGLKVEIRQPEFRLAQELSALNDGENRWPALRELQLETDNLIWQGQSLGPLHSHFRHGDLAWQGVVDSNMAKGRMIIPDQRNGNEAIRLEMDYLDLSALNTLHFTAAEQVIEYLPLIDIDSRQLRWRSVDLGKLKLQTERRSNGVHFKTIRLSDATKTIDFNADWIKLPHGSSTLISGNLNSNDFGRFLSELGCGDDFKETHANIGFSGGWNGTPQQFSLERLHGQLHVDLTDGRISSIDPGFGRLLGLIAMEQWVKRISLDFSDIYAQGLAFNEITGDFKISNGKAFTDNLLIDAVIAKMRIAGTADLISKTLNHNVTVIPKSSDALPIAGTIIGGVAEFITDAIISDYKEGYFFGSEYKVAGRWGNVEVTPVNEHDGLMNKTLHDLTDFDWLK